MSPELTDTELETYSRQIVLADIGYQGQLTLRRAKVCLIGVGGLGSPIATQLVGMGVGYLRIVDRDIVSRSDLHRQHLYDVDSIGLPKVDVAQQKFNRLNPDVKIDAIPESLNSISWRCNLWIVAGCAAKIRTARPRKLRIVFLKKPAPGTGAATLS